MLTISNTGNSTLTISGITGPTEAYTTSWTSGEIGAGGSQPVTFRFTPAAERTYSGTVTVNGDQTSGTNTLAITGTGTRPPGPRTSFGSGTYLVGGDIVAARYFTDPVDGCYWERLSGLGGSASDIIANEFIAFNAGQWIVDILRSDTAFSTDSECGVWNHSPRRGLQAEITAGVWLVGSQITAGRYRANASAGCYWERMRHFEGTPRGVIANDFRDSAGQVIVEIRSSDAGFHSDEDCGTWTRVSTLDSALDPPSREPSASEIESNWERHRQKSRNQ